MTANHQPEPSCPSWDYGAPDLGLGWNWGNPEGRPAAWNAFGQDTDTEDGD